MHNSWTTPQGTPTARLITVLTRLMPIANDWTTATELLPYVGGTLVSIMTALDELSKSGYMELSYGARGVSNRPVRVYRVAGGATCLSA
jgi:hypothetical protein